MLHPNTVENPTEFQIGDRVKLRYCYDEGTDSPYLTDDGDEGVIYGLAWNNGDRWYCKPTWVYWIRLDKHNQPWLPCPFWDPDPIPGDEIKMIQEIGEFPGNFREDILTLIDISGVRVSATVRADTLTPYA